MFQHACVSTDQYQQPELPGQADHLIAAPETTATALKALAYLSPDLEAVPLHHHLTLRVIVALDQPFTGILNTERLEHCRGYIAGPNVPHGYENPGKGAIVVICVHPNCADGRALAARLNGRSYEVLKELPAPPEGHRELPAQHLTGYVQQLLRQLATPYIQAAIAEAPVVAAITMYIAEHISAAMLLEEICTVTPLSMHRARHVFKDTTGMPIAQYILWERICGVLDAVSKGDTYFKACLKMGFTDQPHFNRLFKRMFGHAPTLITSQRRLIPV